MGVTRIRLEWTLCLMAILGFHGTSVGTPLTPATTSTVTVDLGYAIQEGYLETNDEYIRYFNFTNVRYAAPPTGPNRLRPPAEPAKNQSIQTAGPYGIMCPQAQPGWLSYAGSDVGNQTELPAFTQDDLLPAELGSSEDCLFLDVLVPESVFKARTTSTVPVLVFIHGGGYVQGSKTEYGSGAGLLRAAAENERELIYVSINYRLGLFGFLAGTNTTDFPANLGLRDQVFALEWIQKYIGLFGGDMKTVTVMGESAGAGSIMYHLTSPEISSQSLFQRGIVQSPYTYPISNWQQEQTMRQVLQMSNVSSLSELQDLPSESLQTINGMVVGSARPYGTFVFGPVIDAHTYYGYPPVLLAQEQYDHSVQMMEGHNTNEGLLFASPFIHDDSQIESEISLLFPDASQSTISTLTQTLYPSDFGGKYGYVDQLGRIATVMADSTITCNAYFLRRAFEPLSASFAYQFSVPPAWHAADLSYTFMDPDSPEEGVNVTLAVIAQRYFASFAATGSPNTATGASNYLPAFANEDGLIVQNLNNTMLGALLDTAINVENCEWWQNGSIFA